MMHYLNVNPQTFQASLPYNAGNNTITSVSDSSLYLHLKKMEHILHFSLLCMLTANVFGKLTVVQYVALKTRFATLLGTQETVTTNYKADYDNSRTYGMETSYFAFRGIPYAESPVAELRWKDTILKLPLGENSLFNATVEKSPCPQWISKNGTSVLLGDENCLYASVFVPVQTTKSRSPLKIMVYFHGGGFIVNSNRNMLPIPLLAQKNAIVVMFNYRVSIFGWMSFGTAVLPGNYAFLDQITMLKWIQMYGRDFGGDTNDITIFGSSVGSVSIHYLLLSKLATGLFHKAIMESGSAFCERSLVPIPLEISMKLGRILQCSSICNQQLLLACLQSKSMVELMVAAKHLTAEWVLPSVLGPVLDNSSRPIKRQFLPDFPENLPIINKVNVIVGITKDEGLTAFVKLSKDFNWEQLHDLGFIQRTILPHYLNLIMRSRNMISDRQDFIDNLAKDVMNFYRKDFAKDPISTLVGILGDLWINTCNRKTLEHLCINAVPSVHSYLFTHHDAGISPSEIVQEVIAFRENGIDHSILYQGVAHTEEILYMLEKTEGSRLAHFARNKMMSDILSNIWTHFAISSVPPVVNGWPKWSPICYSTGNHTFYDPEYLLYEISLDNHRMFPNYRLQEAEFWWQKHQETFTS